MKKNLLNRRFKLIGIYAREGDEWVLLRKFLNNSSDEGVPLSDFSFARIERIRTGYYWLWDFNDLTRESQADRKIRVKIRLIP